MSSSVPNIRRPAVKVFVATTVMLTFISFWRASAIVLADLASSAYYAGGDAEKVIGKSAPWFILAVMLFSYCVRALYIESSSMFVRGGVYRVVKEAMGGTLAKFSVSALLFDYVLTGPISAVSAGQYLAGFIEDIGKYVHHPSWSFPRTTFAAVFAILIVLYFWWKNIQGMHESSEKALQIMIVTTVMVVILIIWCTITVFSAPVHLPPNPLNPGVVKLNKESLGWLYGTWISHLTWIILFVGFGHSVLAMSGEETLAQVNREIEHPKLKNLEKTGLVIFIYSLLFTSLVSFLRRHDYSRRRPARLLRQPHRWHCDVFGWSHRAETDLPRFRSAGRRIDSCGRAKYLDRRCKRGIKPCCRRRRAHRLVPKTAKEIRHKLSHHQLDCWAAAADHYSEPRKCVRAGRALRLRSDLELCPEVAGGSGLAFHRAGESAMEGARQFSHR